MSMPIHDHKKRWRKGGMTSNGLRASGEVINYFRGPGRQNIIPNATSKQTLSNYKDPISSIGILQNNGLGQVAASEYGPGTLKSTNSQFFNQAIPSEATFGKTLQNDKRSLFVDYRQTDPVLVQNLRNNPLSIYAVGDAKNAPIPAFESYIQPDDYATYKAIANKVDIENNTIVEGIDGSPQVNILGLNQQNPFLGLTQKVNHRPTFLGKTYGGNDTASAKPFANQIYNAGWETNDNKPIQFPNTIETFTNKPLLGACKNKSLVPFAQGYNISNQIIKGKMIAEVGPQHHAVNNLPWGPSRNNPNPTKQEFGIWKRGNNQFPTKNTNMGYQNNLNPPLPKPKIPAIKNCYELGSSSSLVCS